MNGAALDAGTPAAAARPRWPAALAVAAIVLGAYTLIALIGVGQDARGERILGIFTPVFYWLRDTGTATHEWLQGHLQIVGLSGSALLLAIALAAVMRAGRRSGPVLLLTVTVVLAGWAQVSLQGDATTIGLVLYLAAVACAFALGIWVPFKRLAGFPPFPPGSADGPPAAGVDTHPQRDVPRRVPLSWPAECTLVLGLMLVGLISRTWALTELYDFFDLEMIDSMVQARTWRGYAGYLDYGFVQNNGGAVHLIPAEIIFRLFGTSVFTLRMTAVLWSLSAIPLMYALGRRLGGVSAGIFCSIFLITAPEQLFWSRNENVFFSPVALCALVTAHLALWMVQRFSPWAVLCNALWMPWCRWFYSASMVAFLIPITTALHAMIFARRLWRKAWYVVPIIAMGLTFWIFSLSVMKAALHDWQWRFVDPAAVYGSSAWRKHGEFDHATLPQLAVLQAVSMSKNFAEVARNMTYHTENFSHWCQRSQPPNHRTILNVGLSLLVFVGLGYLIPQIVDRRAFLLFAWWGISLLPGLLSQEPAERRMAMMFPASHALAGTVLAAFLHIVAERGGRLAARLAEGVAALGLGTIALTNLSSHLMLPIFPVLYGDYPRVTKPLFERSDAIFTNLPPAFRTFAVFGNLDRFLAAPNCLQFVEGPRWLATALDPQCAFDDTVYNLTVSDAERADLRRNYAPRRVSYVLHEDPVSAPQIALLRALHPTAALERHPVPRTERTLVTMTVDVDAIAALRAPSLLGTDGPLDILAGVPLRRESRDGDGAGNVAPSSRPVGGGAPSPSRTVEGGAPSPPGRRGAASAPSGPRVEGGILIDQDGWYRWSLDPPCPAATLTLDGQAVDAAAARPLLAGVHAFTLAIPSPDACTLPLRIVAESLVPPRTESVGPERFVGRAVADLPAVRARPVDAYPGYAAAEPLIMFKGRPHDFGVDAQGNMSVLMKEGSTHRVHRYDKRGKELAAWDIPVPFTINPASLAVAPDGTTAVLVQREIQLYDPQGKRISSWEHPWLVWETQLAFWGDKLIANIHHRDGLAVYSRTGEMVEEFKTFAGDPGKLWAPMAFTISAEGDMLVQQADGQALRFRLEGDEFRPLFVEQFPADASFPGSGFDGPDRVLIPTEHGLRVFGRGGRRLLASDPKRDPSQQTMGSTVHVRRVGDRLLVLDTERNALWTIPG